MRCVFPVLGILLGLLCAVPAQAEGEPYGFVGHPAPDGPLWHKWRTLSDTMNAEATCGEACAEAAGRFRAMVDVARHHDGRARLAAVNRTVNIAVAWRDDFTRHGDHDVWSAPFATLTAGFGDCEDYAILKYALLREAGVPPRDLRILIVWDEVRGKHHTLLAARLDGWFLLDTIRHDPGEARDSPHYRPVFALDADGVRQAYRLSPPDGFTLREVLDTFRARPTS